MFVMESIEDLWNHIAYVLGCAPDRFPYRDFLPDDQQMNLDRAFEQLRKGIDIAYPETSFSSKRMELNDILDRSYSAYLRKEEILAGRLLNEFQGKIFKE